MIDFSKYESQLYLNQRLETLGTRKIATDYIKTFTKYCEAAGSKNANRYYSIITNLANKSVGVTNRKLATKNQLRNIEFIEKTINYSLVEYIDQGIEYHEIYRRLKNRIKFIATISDATESKKKRA